MRETAPEERQPHCQQLRGLCATRNSTIHWAARGISKHAEQRQLQAAVCLREFCVDGALGGSGSGCPHSDRWKPRESTDSAVDIQTVRHGPCSTISPSANQDQLLRAKLSLCRLGPSATPRRRLVSASGFARLSSRDLAAKGCADTRLQLNLILSVPTVLNAWNRAHRAAVVDRN